MSRITLTLTGETFTDELHSNVGVTAFVLNHTWFTKQELAIRTAAGGGGTLLIEDTDYTLSEESLSDAFFHGLSERVTAALGSGHNVFRLITVINAAYQAVALYFSGKYIADSVKPEDYVTDTLLAVSGEDYTVLDDDDVGCLEVDPDGADRTVTLPTVADNLHRELTIVNSAAVDTAFKVIVEGEGAELINQVTTWWLFPGQNITLKSNGTIWRKIAGHVPTFHVQDQKAAGTDGGTFTSGAFQLRTLNTVVANEIAGASLGSNQMTLPPGLYEVRFLAPAQAVGKHKAKLIIAGGANLIIGSSMNTYNNFSEGCDFIRLAAQTITELRHRCENTIATTGFGIASNMGEIEVYSDVMIRKVV